MIDFPASREALEAAGYIFESRRRCREKVCGKTIEMWKTPALPPTWMPLEAVFVSDPNTLVPHWKFCPGAERFRSLPPVEKKIERKPRKQAEPQRRLFR